MTTTIKISFTRDSSIWHFLVGNLKAQEGTYASADISEKEARGEEVTKGDFVEAGADIFVSGAGSKVTKAAVEYQVGREIVETVTYDIAAEVATEVTYQSGKAVVMQEEGDNNG